jgi:hypothetical protein
VDFPRSVGDEVEEDKLKMWFKEIDGRAIRLKRICNY